MEPIKVKIKKLHKDAVIPKYAHDTDAGLDLTAVSKTIDEYGNVVYGFGLAFEIPKGYVGLIFPRSSNHKRHLTLTNSVGVIDSGYRGEVTAKFSHNLKDIVPRDFIGRLMYFLSGRLRGLHAAFRASQDCSYDYNVGDRVAQMIIIPYPKVEFEETEELSDSDRGANGYGSSGD
ncbi:MAG: dUTP diphosphatase [Paludibacteraceae bacterium]